MKEASWNQECRELFHVLIPWLNSPKHFEQRARVPYK
uniref:Uncharacterized protein n=1 Tax=Anguilla anguilla TaxID=7936 RepID=A0A0E9QG15_ANGAN